MATHKTLQTRRSFSMWLAISGFALTASERVLAQESWEAPHIADEHRIGTTVVKEIKPASEVEAYGQVSLQRQSQDGRPPSEWLRSMDVEELRAWLASVEVPQATVYGMTFWTHLTRDHLFQPLLIKGLTESEQAKLHAAAHFGY